MAEGRRLAVALLLLLGARGAAAQSLPVADDGPAPARPPKWEAGLAAFAIGMPAYPGSDEYRYLVMPAPYFVYHGRVFRADDEEGSRLRQILTPNVELDLSGGGALASDSSHSDARRGMPDLDYLVELGPKLRLSFDGLAPSSKLILSLPARAVVSIGDDLGWQGFVFEPELAWQRGGLLHRRLGLRLSADATFATHALQRYFYEVAPRYATPERPAYAAEAGYVGASLSGRASWVFTPRLRGFVSLSYLNNAGSANEDSPLFRTPSGYLAALGFSWSFLRSREPAED